MTVASAAVCRRRSGGFADAGLVEEVLIDEIMALITSRLEGFQR